MAPSFSMNEGTVKKLRSYYEDTMKDSIDLSLIYDFFPGDLGEFLKLYVKKTVKYYSLTQRINPLLCRFSISICTSSFRYFLSLVI